MLRIKLGEPWSQLGERQSQRGGPYSHLGGPQSQVGGPRGGRTDGRTDKNNKNEINGENLYGDATVLLHI